MQIDINFEQADLEQLYDSLGATFDEKLTDDQKFQWFIVNYLEPYIDNIILDEINRASVNTAYDNAMKQVAIDQSAMQEKVTQAQETKQADLSTQLGIEVAPVAIDGESISVP